MADARKKKRVPIPLKSDDGPAWIAIIITGILQIWPVTAILGFLKLRALWKKEKLKTYRGYYGAIGAREHISLKRLSQAVGHDQSKVIKILGEMISNGYLGSEAYIDHSLGYLVIEPSAASETEEDFESAQRHAEARAEQPKPEPQPEPQQASTAPASEHASTLEKLKELNVQILDEEVSRKIDRITELTDDIYEFVDQNPSRAGEVRKFMNYYLPTTMKLLSSYGMLERQSYQGDNIIASRKDIENILNTLVQAFEKQLDQLFAAQAVDISSDIQVLETMMAKDGLDDQKMTLRF